TDLKSLGAADEAKAYFETAYRAQKAPLCLRLTAAEALNNLAWLCARCGERADEAVALAGRAMALEPENYAYIDTAASAQFAAGNAPEAARLERRALIMRPCDPFMLRQLETFERAHVSSHP